jgi:hypothetical protein
MGDAPGAAVGFDVLTGHELGFERAGEHLGFAAAEMRGDGKFMKQIDFHAAS